MKKIIFMTLLMSGISAFAGTGGYTSTSCMSPSGRTIVTTYFGDDNISMNIIVDGKVSTYDNKNLNVKFTGDFDLIIASKNNSQQAALSGNKANRILTLFTDPRKGTDIDYVGKSEMQTIQLACTSYTKEP